MTRREVVERMGAAICFGECYHPACKTACRKPQQWAINQATLAFAALESLMRERREKWFGREPTKRLKRKLDHYGIGVELWCALHDAAPRFPWSER